MCLGASLTYPDEIQKTPVTYNLETYLQPSYLQLRNLEKHSSIRNKVKVTSHTI